jgi:putative membrane-bound dehydrogenase-like protein
MWRICLAILGFLAGLFSFPLAQPLLAQDANRLTYLDEFLAPYYVGRDFPKLTTPQWVGEEGVEAVVVLAIDDMRDSARYEQYLRPILDRLKEIDGRAPVSIMTNRAEPDDLQLQQWLEEGLSLDVHTYDHPCPCLQQGDFDAARETYERCVDLMAGIPGNRPVAFRMPCCDSLNTPSPRFWAEIFEQTTPEGNFLTIDSSVFQVFTSDDPDLPREAVLREDGAERFRHYIPFPSFVNTIENYPYPYLIGRSCWQFPCMVPSDWEAQHVQQPNNPETVRDLQIALDLTVLKQGVFNLVFHPHGWIRNDQVVELIDHAVAKHGSKVKFLTFREADERMQQYLLAGQPLRAADGGDNGVRLLDLNQNGYLDVVIGNDQMQRTRIWSPQQRRWLDGDFPVVLVDPRDLSSQPPSGSNKHDITESPESHTETTSRSAPSAPAGRFGITPEGEVLLLCVTEQIQGAWRFVSRQWQADDRWLRGLELDGQPIRTREAGVDQGIRLRDLNDDGRTELLVSNPRRQAIFTWQGDGWEPASYSLPDDVLLVDEEGRDAGLRLVDLDEDGVADLLFSNARKYSLHLARFDESGNFLGWPLVARQGRRGDEDAIPMIVRDIGPEVPRNNGAWFHSRHLWVQNEDTHRLPDHVDRRSFDDLLGDQAAIPPPRSPNRSLDAMHVRPGMQVELVVSEPLVADPIALDWGPDGRMWIVEMGDYPSGIGDDGAPAGRVRVLSDTNGDGRYDTSEVFLEGIGFPTGVKVWRNGILVTAAPEIFYAEDTNGDGKGDHRETLYRGFVEGNQQHRVNGLRWGIDNWLHVANGDSGGVIESIRTGKKEPIGGRDLRIRPDTGELEAESGQTQFGRDCDDWGNWFGGNNSNPMWHYVLSDVDLRRNPHWVPRDVRRQVSVTPGAAPVYPASRTLPRFNDFNMANRFTSACSPTIYRDRLLGEAFLGNSFVCEPVHNLVQREVLEPMGATFRSRRADDEQDREFLASEDHWFRPTTVRTGPDGAVWITDMYRLVIEHPEWIPAEWQARLNLRAGENRGRVYRVFPQDHSPRPFPRLDQLETSELVARLAHDNGWVRDMAQQMLLWNDDPEAASHLLEFLRHAEAPLGRLHALATLDGLNQLPVEWIEQSLADPHPGIRRHALRLAATRLDNHPSLREKALDQLTDETDRSVLLQGALAIGETRDATFATKVSQVVAEHLDDSYLKMALISSIHSDNLLPLLESLLSTWPAADEEDSPSTPSAASSPSAALRAYDEVLVALLHFTVATRDLETLTTVVAGLLPDELENGKSPTRQPTGTKQESDQAADDSKTTSSPRLTDIIRRRLSDPDRAEEVATWRLRVLAELIERLPDSLRKEMPDELLEALARTSPLTRDVLEDPEASVEMQAAAARLLANAFWDREATLLELRELLHPRHAPPVQSAAARGLAQHADEVVADYLLENWRSHSPSLRAQILDLIFTRTTWIHRLLQSIEQEAIPAAHVDAVRRQQLLSHRAVTVREEAERVLAASINPDRQQLIEQYLPVAELQGDPDLGRVVFGKQCSVCHRMEGVGHAVGPDLSALTDKSTEGLLAAILDPNRAIEDRYLEYLVVDEDGRQHRGMIANETSNSITLLAQEAKQTDLLRSSIELLTATGQSLMPEGLEKELPLEAMADLFAYLRASRPPAKEFEGNHPELPHVRDDGSIRLLATNCRIYGPTVVFEPQYRNLGYWGDEEDRAVWKIRVPRSGEYQVTLDYACADDVAGNRFLLHVGDQTIGGIVEGTGGWDSYRWKGVGSLKLSEGEHELTFRSDGPVRQFLIDLRGIILSPRN